MIVGFHFGFFRISATSLARILPGCDAVHVSHRNAHYESETIGGVAQLALHRALVADQQSGVRIHYLARDASLLRVCRSLLAGETVALAADGALAQDFLDVPFLGAKLRLPCGWARLAAATRSNVLILADVEIDRKSRKVLLFDGVDVGSGAAEEIRGAVSRAGQVLESLILREPWSWHPWQRLRRETADDGSTVYSISELGGHQPTDGSAGPGCSPTAAGGSSPPREAVAV
jgi:lauroyl/myristoyl acyltransferase